MTWLGLARYLREHWCPFVSSVAFGSGITVLLILWALKEAWVRSFLASQNQLLSFGVLLLIAAILLPAWPRAVDAWRRYL